jgi:hypothetical protein
VDAQRSCGAVEERAPAPEKHSDGPRRSAILRPGPGRPGQFCAVHNVGG